MKKLLLFLFISVFSTMVACAQDFTQSISFDDGVGPGNAGTYGSNDSFSVDLALTFNGYNAAGLSLWFETTANAAPFISLTGFTYGTTFPDPTQPFAGPIGFTVFQSPGVYTTPQPSDFGAIWDAPFIGTPPGTYFVGRLTISLSGLAPGVYGLRTDSTQFGNTSHRSEVAGYFPGDPPEFRDENIPSSEYTITVIPEPGTASLVALSLFGLAAVGYGRRCKS